MTLLVMAWSVEAREPYTGGHLWRVSRMAELLARHAGLSEIDVSRVAIGAFVHDIGKLGVSEAILCKSVSLSDDELDIIHTHASAGAHLLAGNPMAALMLDAVMSHHERPDGSGYPAGLKGDEIPREARIVAICDAFDAMTCERPYGPPMSLTEALDEIRANIGTQFDRRFAEHFLTLAETGELEHIVGHSDDGVPVLACKLCGPTLVVRREQGIGDTVFCRRCGGEHVLATDPHGVLEARQTGRVGGLRDLEARPDLALIQRFVDRAARTVLGRGLRIAA